jgi:hypothetical protein
MVTRAGCDPALTTNPNELHIAYSDEEESNHDKSNDDYDIEGDVNGDSSYESESKCKSDDDDASDGKDNSGARYSDLIDASLLEDEEPAKSYHIDWVKGTGAGRKANISGRPTRPDTTNSQKLR